MVGGSGGGGAGGGGGVDIPFDQKSLVGEKQNPQLTSHHNLNLL